MMTAMKIALGLVTGIVLLAGQNTGTPSSHGEDILSWVQWPAPMACPPQQQHAGASRWFAPTIMRHCGAGGHRLTGRPDRGSRSQRGKSSPPALALTITPSLRRNPYDREESSR